MGPGFPQVISTQGGKAGARGHLGCERLRLKVLFLGCSDVGLVPGASAVPSLSLPSSAGTRGWSEPFSERWGWEWGPGMYAIYHFSVRHPAGAYLDSLLGWPAVPRWYLPQAPWPPWASTSWPVKWVWGQWLLWGINELVYVKCFKRAGHVESPGTWERSPSNFLPTFTSSKRFRLCRTVTIA